MAFSKGLFLGERLIFSNETNENEMFVNAFHRPRLLCELSVVRGNNRRGEQRKHQNGEGRKTRGREKILRLIIVKRKEVRVGLGSPSSFVVPGPNCSAHVRKATPRPSAAISIRKKYRFQGLLFPARIPFNSTPIFSFGRPALDQKTVCTDSNVNQK